MPRIEEKTCEHCGADILAGQIEDPLNLTYGHPEIVVLDAAPAMEKAPGLYRTYYRTGSGDYVKRVTGATYRVHACPAAAEES